MKKGSQRSVSDNRRGKFLTLEGIEGVGKSTQIKAIEKVLSLQNIAFLTTREPGGTELAESIRSLLLNHHETSIDAKTELLLMFAARSHHVETLIKPALARGEWVVCDRFTDSTYAYQGGGRLIDEDLIRELEILSLGDFTPDATILLDVPVEIGMARAANRSEKDRFETESPEFFERVRHSFLDRAHGNPRYHVIDASIDLDDVADQVSAIVSSLVASQTEDSRA